MQALVAQVICAGRRKQSARPQHLKFKITLEVCIEVNFLMFEEVAGAGIEPAT